MRTGTRTRRGGKCACLPIYAHTSTLGRAKWLSAITRLTAFVPCVWFDDLEKIQVYIVCDWCFRQVFYIPLVGIFCTAVTFMVPANQGTFNEVHQSHINTCACTRKFLKLIPCICLQNCFIKIAPQQSEYICRFSLKHVYMCSVVVHSIIWVIPNKVFVLNQKWFTEENDQQLVGVIYVLHCNSQWQRPGWYFINLPVWIVLREWICEFGWCLAVFLSLL